MFQSHGKLVAGGAWCDITPQAPTHLYGYPHVPRVSTGVHDPLLASALYLSDGSTQLLFVCADVIWLSKSQVTLVRTQIAERTGVPADHVMVTATHTHSGPVTVALLSNAEDSAVPPPDPNLVAYILRGVVTAAENAVLEAEAAELTKTIVEFGGLGSNRLDPSGPRITEIPVLAARSVDPTPRWLGIMYINPVHPTVLHEDSTVISGDFPSMCREYLQASVLDPHCPVLCHLGAAGNQSPRHMTRSNTIEEAQRLGQELGRAIEQGLTRADFASHVFFRCRGTAISLPPRPIPSTANAAKSLGAAEEKLTSMRQTTAPPALIRTAECEVFGAEETLALARAADNGATSAALDDCLPAEIQVIDVGDWSFVGWPGEVFVEFALQLRRHHPNAFVVTLANGELQGYLVTADALSQKCYESGNALFASPDSGEHLVAETSFLLSSGQDRTLVDKSAQPSFPRS